ncbi:aminopeptidase N [Hydrocarboniphaga daqingensis]|uniref:Aminopeptidase N n=1 Tax=Hydrocarboniphaga daqingensis TaxID=490188 RepID=A0A1M5RQP1_9GAMM|nr:aminopeptidase N [Hydrocarboniphaga daqingensis]SHH28519.1 aminopeptidase N [Hydrocarboniphaga daqingensis]
MSHAAEVFRKDYRLPAFLVDQVDLAFDIRERTTVQARLQLRRNPAVAIADEPLVLDGRGFDLLEVAVDDRRLGVGDYQRTDDRLQIAVVPDRFTLRIVTQLDPEQNTTLEGLYRSGSMLCTQCEARGFSRITYYPDRPDVLSRFSVRVEADAQRFPVLLSNGNPVESGALPDGRHYTVWDDPFLKPCYLFALVAGDLACIEDHYTTASGRDVALRFYVDHGNEARVPHAMASLKRAMRWDEQVYGLEYDLDLYMVVAARDFNMGAMENKGLNLFNARYVLASPQTATDADYDGIESVIAHEYFHNWTGNRVTCRDWFQLSLKEGLTVFRDQCFSQDLNGEAVHRIQSVRQLRTVQFPEDAGPMAHPVRPDSYVEINNFYTATVYEKGAEIVRMIQTLLGRDTFIAGVQRYLREHDGSAATIEDFLAAHEAESGRNLDGFRRWYSQPGTPLVTITDEYDARSRVYRLRLKQSHAPSPNGAPKQMVPIPIRFALRDHDGRRISVSPQPPLLPAPDLILLEDEEAVLNVPDIGSSPNPSFLLGFSAPVRLQFAYTSDQLVSLLLDEEDGFARWEAAQRLMLNAFFELQASGPGDDTRALLDALQRLAARPVEDRALLAELLRMPSESYLASQVQPLDAARLTSARDALRLRIAQALTGPLSVWSAAAPEEPGASNAARRALANVSLWYLMSTRVNRVLDIGLKQAASPNMTVAFGALTALNDIDCPQREAAMDAFLQRFRHEPLVLDKWFALQAGSAIGQGVERVRSLLQHPDFTPNPNRLRAVLGTFWRENLRAYHRADGAGYRLLGDQIAHLDRSNPQIAARLCDGLLGWKDIVPPQNQLLRAVLVDLSQQPLSADVGEKIGKALL